MAHWLVKQEPSTYSWEDLRRDGTTTWDGIHNAAALLHLRKMHPGDDAILYHSGEQRACVGVLAITSEPRRDDRDPRPSWTVDVAAVRALGRPVTLAEIKADPAFSELGLVRISRLSVMPVPEAAWKRLMSLAARPSPASSTAKAGTRGRGRAPARRARGAAARRTH